MTMKRILVACEESQTVTKAFRKRGFEAFSCDIQDCSGGHPEWHIKGDVFKAIDSNKWDLIIMHPPCTKVCCTGNRVYAKGKPRHSERVESVKWIKSLWIFATKNCSKVAMENPQGVLNSLIPELPKPNYIQPYEHGHIHSKKTGLWLYGLPPILPTNIVTPEWIISKSGKRHSRIHWENPGNSKIRSKTFEGIAEAMADQWGKLL